MVVMILIFVIITTRSTLALWWSNPRIGGVYGVLVPCPVKRATARVVTNIVICPRHSSACWGHFLSFGSWGNDYVWRHLSSLLFLGIIFPIVLLNQWYRWALAIGMKSCLIHLSSYPTKTSMSYSAKSPLYCSSRPSVFYHIVLNVDVSTFFFQYFSQTFAVCSCSGRILFNLVWQKIIKHCMARTFFCGWFSFFLWQCTVMFQIYLSLIKC